MNQAAEPRTSQHETARSLALAMLIVVMDMSGMAGTLAVELEDGADRLETLSSLNMPGFQSGLAITNQTFDISRNGDSACMVLDDQSLWCWGDGTDYALGTGNQSGSVTPVPVLRDSGWAEQTIAVSLGGEHNCELLAFGTVQCWGDEYPAGADGPLVSAGFSLTQSSPAPVTLDSAAVLVDSEHDHSCAILDNGSVQCWGDNLYGQLGIGYRCLVGNEGDCGAHGQGNKVLYPHYAILPPGRTAVGLNLFQQSTCIILDDGAYVCTGRQFGDPISSSYATTPLYLNDSNTHVDFADAYSAVDGGNLLVTQAWTWNNLNSLERTLMRQGGTNTPHYFLNTTNGYCCGGAVEGGIVGIAGSTTSDDSGQEFRTGCTLLSNNSLGCGRNDYTYIDSDLYTGYLSRAWIELPGGSEPAAVVSKAGSEHLTCVVTDNGSAMCWGENTQGQMGDGTTCTYPTSMAGCTQNLQVNSPRWVSIPAGRHIALGELDADGDGVSVSIDRCPDGTTGWTSSASTDYDGDGCQDSGEDLDDDNDGHEDTSDAWPYDEYAYRVFTALDGFYQGVRYENVSASGMAFLDEDGCVYQIQDNPTWDQCGSTSFRSLPASPHGGGEDNYAIYPNGTTDVSALGALGIPVTAIALGLNYQCALLEDDSMRCWGNNNEGQLGIGGNSDVYAPTNVSFPTGEIPVAISLDGNQDDFTCALMLEGDVYCWGENNQGQLGFGNVAPCPSLCDDSGDPHWPTIPVQFSNPSPASSIYAPGSYPSRACAVHTDGNASCWGYNGDGVLGNGFIGQAEHSPQTVYNPTSQSITQMALSGGFTCALMDNGEVYCWGVNNDGQLGDGTICSSGSFSNNCNGNYVKPIMYDPVVLPNGTTAISIFVANNNDGNQNSYDENVCALLSNGRLFCWGSQYSSWLDVDTSGGLNGNDGIGTYPIEVTGNNIQPGNRDWDGDGVFNYLDNCADGTPGWTSTTTNDFDGDGCDDATEDTDDDNDGFSDTTETNCGTNPVDANEYPEDIDGDGLCASYDDDDDGDGILDVDDAFPEDQYGFVQLSLGDGFQSGQPEDNATIGGGSYTVCSILSDGTMRCWGENNNGQTGNGTVSSSTSVPLNVSIPAGRSPASVSSGSQSSTVCSIMDDGSLYCWGSNTYGQLGIGTDCDSGSYLIGCNGASGISTPSPVNLPTGRTATAVATGGVHTCAILDDGSVWCWGSNTYGQLGIGNSSTGTWAFSPNPVSMPSGVSSTSISMGSSHTCVVTDDGDAYCWGSNTYGQLGDNTWTDNNLPTQVYTSASYASISSGSKFNCAITTTGAVQCWGSNSNMQLGLGYYYGDSGYPMDTDIPSGTEVASIALGNEHACAVTTEMSVYCWGHDSFYQLGTSYNCQQGDHTNGCYGWNDGNRHTPALSQLPTGRNGIAVATGAYHTCVFIDNGGLYCFGRNDYNQIGTQMGSSTYGPWYIDFPTGVSPMTNDRDLDHDGVFNNDDDCMEGETGWTSNASTDNDGDGCRDSSEDLDDDNDFLEDTDEATAGTNSTDPDTDDDGYLDGLDEFPLDGSEWIDTDGDGIGNNADTDDDDDGWSDAAEYSCQTDPLNGTDIPSDFDGDGNCDYTDNDDDNDGTYDSQDDFPFDAGADTDTDGDGMPDTLIGNYTGDLVEDTDDDNDGWNDTTEVSCGNDPLSNMSVPSDIDGDTVCDTMDAFPSDPSEWDDTDGDGIGDNSDAFPNDASESSDNDGDGIGDNADTDDDNDGWDDNDEVLCLTDPLDSSSIPGDIDSDGICDALEQDLDNDGWSNANETLCGTDWQDVNSVPIDTDGDWVCDIMDYDDDGDGWLDEQDAYPLDPEEWLDTDGDGIGDNADPDADNDGCMDVSDDLPLDPTECDDTDGDGIGNNADTDDDGDGLPDSLDPFPLDGAATVDTDGDGMPDYLNGNSTTGLVEDADDDNDGWNDTDDAFPLNVHEWLDTDGDGIGNNADVNDDGDNCPDVSDDFPLDPSECYDTDGDGIGNNADNDDDNDGWLDGTEMACGAFDPLNASSVPDDFDGDHVCDLMDADDDNDSYVDSSDSFQFDPCAAVDTDGDGYPDWIFFNCNTTLVEDWDDDNDGYDDANDSFPQDPLEWKDNDNDGIGDNADTDDDGDNVPDIYDAFPLNGTEWADNDNDGIGDNADTDDDNDGTPDEDDAFPTDAGADTDTDDDGMPDTLATGYNGTLIEDSDDDGDGVLDVFDAFPLDPTEWSDTDGDGTGDNHDADDDGDGWSDDDEWICGTNTLDNSSFPPDSDGDGICDSEDDDSEATTLGGKFIQLIYEPVMMWMLMVGVALSLIMGMTATGLALRKDRNLIVDESRRVGREMSEIEDKSWQRTSSMEVYSPPTRAPPIDTGASRLSELIDQGYSPEVAEAIIESEK